MLRGPVAPQCRLTLQGHENTVNCCSVSPDGALILSTSWDKSARLWDRSGRNVQTLNCHEGAVLCGLFTQEGRSILTCSEDGTLKLCDIQASKSVLELVGHSGTVTQAAVSPDGSVAVSAGWDGTVKVWDLRTRAVIRDLVEYPYGIWSVSMTHDCNTIASGAEDGTIKLWDTRTGRSRATLAGHSGPVCTVSFSPDQIRLLSGSADKSLRIWESDSAQLRRVFEGHADRVFHAIWAHDAKSFISASADKSLFVWDPTTGVIRHKIQGHTDRVHWAHVNPDGSGLVTASADRTVRVWQYPPPSQQQQSAPTQPQAQSSHGSGKAAMNRLVVEDEEKSRQAQHIQDLIEKQKTAERLLALRKQQHGGGSNIQQHAFPGQSYRPGQPAPPHQQGGRGAPTGSSPTNPSPIHPPNAQATARQSLNVQTARDRSRSAPDGGLDLLCKVLKQRMHVSVPQTPPVNPQERQALLKNVQEKGLDRIYFDVMPQMTSMMANSLFRPRAKLDRDGAQWEVNREFELLDKKPINITNEGKLQGNHLCFRVIHKGQLFYMTVVCKAFSARAYQIPYTMTPHQNVINVRHHYRTDIGAFGNWIPKPVMEQSDNGVVSFALAEPHMCDLATMIERRKQRLPKPPYGLDERDVLLIILQLCRALCHVAREGYTHRNLTGENILVGHRGEIMLSGFDFSRAIGAAGDTPMFVDRQQIDDAPRRSQSPEVRNAKPSFRAVNGPNGQQQVPSASLQQVYEKNDIWCVGRMLHALLHDGGRDSLVELEKRTPFMYHDNEVLDLPNCYSPLVRALTRAMVCVDPANRISAADVVMCCEAVLWGPPQSVQSDDDLRRWLTIRQIEVLSTEAVDDHLDRMCCLEFLATTRAGRVVAGHKIAAALLK
eukprot:GFYU01003210.1.p1 GENE.GFYU01003210.1~~GFYU01003210.1.p1  ORF type:complete len:885 (-),score=212.97 GFYU01003210.1:1735-4389(-)